MFLTAHRAVFVDAAATTITAVLMLATRNFVYPYFGLTSPLFLDVAAVAFLVYAAIIAFAARGEVISRVTLLSIVAANIAYVVASLGVLAMFWPQLHPVGRGLIVAVALAVEGFATMQYMAARRPAVVEPA